MSGSSPGGSNDKHMGSFMSDSTTIIRAFELPLNYTEPGNWEIIRECWKQGSMLANWCVKRLMTHDIVRMPEMTKLPPMKPFPKLCSLYVSAGRTFGLMSNSWWSGQSGSFAKIIKNVEDEWKDHRYATLGKNKNIKLRQVTKDAYTN